VFDLRSLHYLFDVFLRAVVHGFVALELLTDAVVDYVGVQGRSALDYSFYALSLSDLFGFVTYIIPSLIAIAVPPPVRHWASQPRPGG